MAFLDFLNQGIGGMQQAQGPNITGDAGVGAMQPIGPTWGNALQAGMQYGSKPGSSGPMVASAIPSIQQAAQPAPMLKTPQEKNPQDESSITAIVNALMGLIGMGI